MSTAPATDPTRIRGCLLGAACADALGAPFEGRPLVDPAELRAWADGPMPLRHTDDTAMTIVVAEHLAAAAANGQAVSEQDILSGFIRGWEQDPHCGYGPGMHELFGQIVAGTPARHAAERLYGGAGSMGNGAAMRTAPIGLLGLDLVDTAALARRVARTTHTHPLGVEGAALQAVAVALAADSDTRKPLNRAAFVADIRQAVIPMAYALQLNRLANLPAFTTPHQIATWFGNDATALSSVPAAIAAFLTAPDDPEAAILTSIEIGGDTDTIACMTGALAGARCGAPALPGSWLLRLQARELLEDIAERFSTHSPV
jgi:poly(ADP-ribose) glycohydrolase ARH3